MTTMYCTWLYAEGSLSVSSLIENDSKNTVKKKKKKKKIFIMTQRLISRRSTC